MLLVQTVKFWMKLQFVTFASLVVLQHDFRCLPVSQSNEARTNFQLPWPPIYPGCRITWNSDMDQSKARGTGNCCWYQTEAACLYHKLERVAMFKLMLQPAGVQLAGNSVLEQWHESSKGFWKQWLWSNRSCLFTATLTMETVWRIKLRLQVYTWVQVVAGLSKSFSNQSTSGLNMPRSSKKVAWVDLY